MKKQRRKKRLDPNTLLLIKQVVAGVLLLMLFAIIIFSIWYGTRISAVTIKDVEVEGGETISHQVIKNIVTQKLEGTYLGLIPRQFSYMYPRQEMLDDVSELERIKSVSIERETLTELSVLFEEFIPSALWCTKENEKCVFLDQTGYAFGVAPSLSGGSFLRLSKLGVEPVTGIQAFSTETFEKVNRLVDLLEANNWYIASVEVDVANDAYLTLTEGGELKVTLVDEAEQIVENLFAVLSSPDFSDIGVGTFEYIDLRFGNKVFINEFELEVASSTEDTLE